MAKEGVSVVVCCYNSATRLPETLRHLCSQQVPLSISWEIIVVDNNSTDNTYEVALAIWESFNKAVPFKIVREPKQGLTYARATGVQEAQFEYIIFCDDDNWLEKNYVHYAYCIMNENKKIGVLGGQSEAVCEADKPFWFDRFQNAYAVGKPLQASGIANARTYLAGAGMVIRKCALQLMQQFSFKQLLTDRKGKELSSGGDVELCLVTMFLGYDLYFDERLKFVHFIPVQRLSWKYCVEMMTKGHSIPQIYFHFYLHCYHTLFNNREPRFADGYRSLTNSLMKNVARNFVYPKNFWKSFKCLIRTEPGSKKEIEVKSTINKLRYLLINKKALRVQFATVKALLIQIKNDNRRSV